LFGQFPAVYKWRIWLYCGYPQDLVVRSSQGLRSGVEVETTAVEVDRGPVMLPVPVSACHEFYHLDLAVDSLARGVRDPVLEVVRWPPSFGQGVDRFKV
jgi:hypothetical protein